MAQTTMPTVAVVVTARVGRRTRRRSVSKRATKNSTTTAPRRTRQPSCSWAKKEGRICSRSYSGPPGSVRVPAYRRSASLRRSTSAGERTGPQSSSVRPHVPPSSGPSSASIRSTWTRPTNASASTAIAIPSRTSLRRLSTSAAPASRMQSTPPATKAQKRGEISTRESWRAIPVQRCALPPPPQAEPPRTRPCSLSGASAITAPRAAATATNATSASRSNVVRTAGIYEEAIRSRAGALRSCRGSGDEIAVRRGARRA